MNNELPELILEDVPAAPSVDAGNQDVVQQGGTNQTQLTTEVAPVVGTQVAEKKDESLDFDKLSDEKKKLVSDFVEKIDVSNTNQVLQYGGAAQNKIAEFSNNVLQNVKTKDTGDAGKMLSSLVVELKDIDDGDDKGFFGLFKNEKKHLHKMVAKYDETATNIEKIVSSLESHKMNLQKDIQMYDVFYQNNLKYIDELNMYIIAGDKKLQELKEKTLPEYKEKADKGGDEDIQNYQDMVNFVDRFDKKVHDLKLSRMVAIQMAPQIRMLQNNDALLSDKIQSSIVNAIPLWKNQMVIALGLTNAKNALKAQKQVTDLTNSLLIKNSEALKQGTVEIAKENERAIIDIETVKKTNEDLISTINEVVKIQQEGSAKRRAAEGELNNLEAQFKKALLSAKG